MLHLEWSEESKEQEREDVLMIVVICCCSKCFLYIDLMIFKSYSENFRHRNIIHCLTSVFDFYRSLVNDNPFKDTWKEDS